MRSEFVVAERGVVRVERAWRTVVRRRELACRRPEVRMGTTFG